MRHVAVSMVAFTVIAGVAFGQKPDPSEVDGSVEWVFDYEQAKQLSFKSGKPMFVVFRCER